MPDSDLARFEGVVLPHLDVAYRLARRLLRHDEDAEDAVQEALLRALRYFAGYRGGSARAWVLTIVRHACYGRLRRPWASRPHVEFDEEHHTPEGGSADPAAGPARDARTARVREALDMLPPRFREVIVLREIEELSYKEIADIAGVPVGTVMSRLARARSRLERLLERAEREGVDELR